MDPLSLTVGAIALVGVCRKVLKGLKILESFSQIPDNIAALIDELQDFHSILTTLCIATGRTQAVDTRSEDAEKLKPLLLKASNIIASLATHCGISIHDHQDFDILLDSTFGSHSTGPKLDLLTKFRWLKDQKKLDQICRRLKVVRLDLSTQLASLNLLNSYSILTEVREIATICRKMSLDSCIVGESQSILIPAQAEMGDVDGNPTAFAYTRPDVAVTPGPDAPDTLPPPYQSHSVPAMSSCSCACHRVRTFETPQIGTSLFGSLRIRVKGVPVLVPACDQILCKRNKSLTVNASFRLPSWFSNRSIDMFLKSHQTAGPQLNLFSTRTVSRNSDIFCLAMQGDTTGIKRLFSRGLASPYDASHNYGYTALHYAADYGHLDLCDFLVKAGAKPDVQDFDNKTSTDLAYNSLIACKNQDWDSERVQEIFDEESWLEQKQFTNLHKIVLGIAKTTRSLSQELSASVRDINVGDCEERTPLSWAAERGDVDAVRMLLKYGAGCDHGDRDGNTAVHYGCKTTAGPTVLSVLLNAGASPIRRNKWGQTPLNWATFFQDDPEFVKCLLFHPGVSLTTDRDHYGSTPLGNAAFSSHANMLRFLLDKGADPNAALDAGEIPLLDCISRNNHQCLQILLDKAVSNRLNIARKDENGESCLHYLARRADLTTISIFFETVERENILLSGLQTSCVGKEGLTPRNILALRADEEIQKALGRVLALVDREAASEASSVRSEDVVYADAFELLPRWEETVGLKEPISTVYEIYE